MYQYFGTILGIVLLWWDFEKCGFKSRLKGNPPIRAGRGLGLEMVPNPQRLPKDSVEESTSRCLWEGRRGSWDGRRRLGKRPSTVVVSKAVFLMAKLGRTARLQVIGIKAHNEICKCWLFAVHSPVLSFFLIARGKISK